MSLAEHSLAQGWANIFYGGPHWRFYYCRGRMLVSHILNI